MAKESSFLNMTLCLTAVTFICSSILGGVYALTKSPIEAAAEAKINDAIQLVVPEFDNNPSSDSLHVGYDGREYVVYPARRGEESVGYAIETSTSKGFGGAIKMMVGFNMDGDITGTSVLSHAETPGLGAKMTEESFSSQFKGKNPASFRLSVKKEGGDIDAITASTITSKAYADAVEKAYMVFKTVTDKNAK